MTFRNVIKKDFNDIIIFVFLSEYLYRKPLFLLKNGQNYEELIIKIL